MTDVNLNNTASNIRSVAQNNYIVPHAKCNLFKGSLTFSGVIVWNSIPLSKINVTVFGYICEKMYQLEETLID